MTNPGPSMGWKNRRDKAAAKDFNSPDDERAAIRAARQALYDQQAADAAASAIEAAKLQARARVSCPCCDSGPVDIELAGRIVTALSKLPAHVPNDAAVMAALNAVVLGREIDRASIYTTAHDGLRVPHRVYAETPAEVQPKVTAAVAPKVKR